MWLTAAKAWPPPPGQLTPITAAEPCPACDSSWAIRTYGLGWSLPAYVLGAPAQRAWLSTESRSAEKRFRLPSGFWSRVRGADTVGRPNHVSRNERVQSAQLLDRPGTPGPPSFCRPAQFPCRGSANTCGVPSGFLGWAFSRSCWWAGSGVVRPSDGVFRSFRMSERLSAWDGGGGAVGCCCCCSCWFWSGVWLVASGCGVVGWWLFWAGIPWPFGVGVGDWWSDGRLSGGRFVGRSPRGGVVGRLGVSVRGVLVRGGDVGPFCWVFRDGVVGRVLGWSVRGVVALGVVDRGGVVGPPAAGACVGMGPAVGGGMAPGAASRAARRTGPPAAGRPRQRTAHWTLGVPPWRRRP